MLVGGAELDGAGVVDVLILGGQCRHQKLRHSLSGAAAACATVVCSFRTGTISKPSFCTAGSGAVAFWTAASAMVEALRMSVTFSKVRASGYG